MKPKNNIARTRTGADDKLHPVRRSKRLTAKQDDTTKPIMESRKRSRSLGQQIHMAKKPKKKENVPSNQGLTQETTREEDNERPSTTKSMKMSTGIQRLKTNKKRSVITESTGVPTTAGNREDNDSKSQPNKEIRCKRISTFSTNKHFYQKRNLTRFSGVVFLDDSHILVADDGTSNAKSGFRVCCFHLDGTLVADLELQAMPWAVLALSSRDAVVTLRKSKSSAYELAWLSIDVERGAIECTKTIQMTQDAFGIAYNENDEMFVVSHHHTKYMTILNKKGEVVGKAPADPDCIVSCTFIGKDIKYLARFGKYIKLIDINGNEKSVLKHPMLSSPTDFDFDGRGNMYVANDVDSEGKVGNVCLFNADGNYVSTLLKHRNILGIALNRSADMLAATHEKVVSIYKLHQNL